MAEESTLHRPTFDPTPIGKAFVTLSVIEGPDRGTTVTLDPTHPAPLLVGTSPACDLQLTDRSVSRRHVSFELAGGALRVKDLGSTNGTAVRSVQVLDARLSGDEIIVVGGTSIQLARGRADRAPKLPNVTRFGGVIGASTEMRRLYPLCERLAASAVPVVIEGETGTGKEVLAESIHEQSNRKDGPFVVFDCTTVPGNLLEAELFGHEAGAFTGATAMRKGFFEQAHGGTLLIDEIGDLDIAMQPKLLRALERSEIRRVGGTGHLRVDVRVIAATRRDLDQEVQAGRFRDDLFHRLAVARIELPPLRNRRGDVAVLVNHMAQDMGGVIPSDLIARWEDQAWPGNVRELRNAVARHIALGDLASLSPKSMRPPSTDLIENVLAMDLTLQEARKRVVDHFQERYLERVLERHGGDVKEAARAAGIARRYFYLLRSRSR